MSAPVSNDRWNEDARTAVGELCTWLARHDPVDARERQSIDEFLAVVPGLQAPFDEHADPMHVTASCIVVGDRGVVLHEHKRLGLWLQPGGHVERGETLPEATLREARVMASSGLRVESSFVSRVRRVPKVKASTR